jgi:phosphonate transport system substrate-binding protein
LSRRHLLLAPLAAPFVGRAHAAEPIRFGVGPFQPTPGDTRRAYEPFFSYLAQAVGRPFELSVTTDFAGISVALASDQVDCAWLGPWGYVLARDHSKAEAVAVVKYNGKPTYQAIIVARPDLAIARFPEDAKGLSISFADAGSTSGYLIPSWWFKTQGIDPKTYFKYRDGATHPANEIAVASGQSDLATDYDRNLQAMIDSGKITPDQVKIVWRSEPLPNDALAVRAGLDPALKAALAEAALKIDDAASATLLPPHYTGWVAAKPDSYALIETAGHALNLLKGA